MVGSVFQYSHISTKVRARVGKMVSQQDYKEMLNKKSVHDVAAFLKNLTTYKGVFEGVNESDVHRGELENRFKKAIIQEYRDLGKSVSGNDKKFLKHLWVRLEIEELKQITRRLNLGKSLKEEEIDAPSIEHYYFHTSDLLQAKNMQDLMDKLSGTPYYDIYAHLFQENQVTNMFNIEMGLDLYFYRWLLTLLKNTLNGQNEKVVLRSLGNEVDIINIMWIYRCKKFYQIPKEFVYRYLIPHRYRITKELITDMVEAKDYEELEQIVLNSRYAHIFEDRDDNYFEKNYLEYIYNMHKRIMRVYPFSVSVLVSYFHLKEVEIRNIISIIEGIRYNIPADTIKKYLVGVGG